MKIYHTETQADYDALMVELEGKGFKWAGGSEMLQFDIWNSSENLTSIRVYGSEVNHASLNYYKEEYPYIPIVKYKAKADDKMKFTKENIYRLFGDYRRNKNGIHRLDDLESAVMYLDDTQKKAVVPKCFDEWYQEIKSYWKSDSSAKQFALWKLCQQGFGHSFEDVRGRKISYASDLARWLRKNEMLAIDAILNGYTIEKEVLYYIPLPHLKTTDGIQQVLTKRSKNGRHYFASRPNDKLKQRYTKEELEQVPEIYKPYAKPIEEEEE